MATAPIVNLIREPRRAAALLNPLRVRLLEELRQPGSASTLARRLRRPRQQLAYHLRQLEKDGLVELVEERRKGNCIERVVRSSARYYLISPATLGRLAADPEEIRDRFSSAYLAAVAARTIADLADLRQRADRAGKRLATFTLQSEIRFATAEQRSAFAEELSVEIARLVAKYHDESAEGGRRFKLIAAAYPAVAARAAQESKPKEES